MSQTSRHLWPAAAMVALVAFAGCSGSPASPDVSEPATIPSPTLSPSATPTPSASPSATAAPAPSPSPDSTEPAAPQPVETSAPAALDALPLFSLSGFDQNVGRTVLGGFVVGLIEDGGVCTYVVSKGGAEVLRRSTTGESNKDDTSCGIVELTRSDLPAGSYHVTLIYQNSRGIASSQAVSLEVP